VSKLILRNTLALAVCAILTPATSSLAHSGEGHDHGHGEKHDHAAPAADAKPAEDKAVAKVNGTNVMQSDVDFHLQRNPMAGQSPDGKQRVIDDIVESELLYQKAIADGADKDPKAVTMLNNIRRAVMAQSVVRKHMESSPIKAETIKAEYDKQYKEGPTEYNARHILLKTEDEAKAVIAELDKGGDFIKLADEKTQDPSGKGKGGDLGWFPPEQMVPEFSEAAKKLEKGKYTKAPIKSQFGFHVIKLEDSRKAQPPAFDMVKQEIEQKLQQEQIKTLIDGLKKNAKVEMVK
jgi:peptidyl-prolyl cis-trans isomerase C